jgi:prolyl 4-hydroxylase
MPSLSSISGWSLIQYSFFAVIVYFLAGAPLSNLLVELNAGGGTSVGSASVGQEKLDSLVVPEKGLRCGEHDYKGVHILSREPLVVYIEGFLGEEEARHAVGVRYVIHGTRLWKRSSLPYS